MTHFDKNLKKCLSLTPLGIVNASKFNNIN